MKGKYILRLAQSGSEVTICKPNENEIHVYMLQHTLQVKAKENTFCVWLNTAPKLQHTLQVKAKETTLQVKANENTL